RTLGPRDEHHLVMAGERRGPHGRDEMRERIQINSDDATPERESLDDGRATTHERVKENIPGLRERLDDRASDCWREPSRIVIEIVGASRGVALGEQRFLDLIQGRLLDA